MDSRAQIAKDLLEGRSLITYVKAGYSMKFMMRASKRKNDLRFFKTLFRYLTQKKFSSFNIYKKIYNFNFPSDVSNYIMMELRFDKTNLCSTAHERWKIYEELLGDK